MNRTSVWWMEVQVTSVKSNHVVYDPDDYLSMVYMRTFLENNRVDACAATESGKSLQTQMNEREFATPRKKESIPLFVSVINYDSPCFLPVQRFMHNDDYCDSLFMFQCSAFTPSCDEKLKPKVGMAIKSLFMCNPFFLHYMHACI